MYFSLTEIIDIVISINNDQQQQRHENKHNITWSTTRNCTVIQVSRFYH